MLMALALFLIGSGSRNMHRDHRRRTQARRVDPMLARDRALQARLRKAQAGVARAQARR